MRSKSIFSSRHWLAVAIYLLAPVVSSAQSTFGAPRITQAIDNSSRVVIPHSTHPLALPAYDVGSLDGSAPLRRMILLLDGTPDQDYQLSVLLDSQQTEGSPDYHRWLTPNEFGQQFGPAPQDIQTVTAWLQQQGFSVDRISRSGKFIQFSGTSSQVEAAFQTRMRRYQVNGEAHIANATNISIPAALVPVVRGVVSLHNFFKKPMISRYYGVHRNPEGMLAPLTPETTVTNNNGTFHYVSPDDFAKIYDTAPLLAGSINGAEQTVGIVAESDISLSDVTTFQSIFGLPNNPPTVTVDGDDPGDVTGGADVEATLDVEWANAAAPGAQIDLVVSESTLISDGADLSALYIVDQNLAQLVSQSIGGCEVFATEAGAEFQAALWQQAAAQGISVFAASGDEGAAGCDPNAPVPPPGAQGGLSVNVVASTPFDTAVGGTEFNETGAKVNPSPGTTAATFWSANNGAGFESALGYIPEVSWNDSCVGCESAGDDSLEATGGGVSIFFQIPSYQTLDVTGLSAALTAAGASSARGVPDVALATSPNHDGYLFCFSEDPSLNGELACSTSNGQIQNAGVVGGTSVSSPAFAGIVALVNQKVGTPQGLANYVLYSLAAAETFSNCNSNTRTNPTTGTTCVFNDVTLGTNGVPGNDVTNDPARGDLGYPAGTGYDLATGLGSVDAKNLVSAWNTAAAAFKGSKTSITSPATINIVHGANVALNVDVASLAGGPSPTGNVALETDQTVTGIPGTSMIEGLVLSSGTASTGEINFLPGGSYNIFASYPGDGTYGGSVSAKVPVTVSKENSFITLFTFQPPLSGGEEPSTSISVTYGTLVGLEALVSGASAGNQLTNSGDGFATGTVAFASTLNGTTTNLGSAITLNSQGEAFLEDCPTNCFGVGTNTVNATYTAGSDPSFNSGSTPANGPPITVTVTSATTTTTVTSPSSGKTVNMNTPVAMNATVTTESAGAAPNGTVTFYSGGTQLGNPVPVTGTAGTLNFSGVGNFAAATASLTTTSLPAGTDSITAKYNGDTGDTNYAASPSSSPITVTVQATTPTFTISANPTTIPVSAPGGSGSTTLTFTAMNGFSSNGAVTVTPTYAGLPSETTCTASFMITIPANGTASTMITCQTTAPSSLTPNSRNRPDIFSGRRAVWAVGLACIFALALMAVGHRLGRLRWAGVATLAVAFAIAAGAGCGGGGTTTTTNPGTPPGNYTNISATVTINGVTESVQNLDLDVQ